MPNWCSNRLFVSGPSEDVERMRREVRSSKDVVFDLEMILPTPRDLMQGQGWYDWRVSNWGTKWDVDDAQMERISSNELEYSFESAWSPPSSVIKALGVNFPSLKFSLSYDEPGAGFIGRLEIEGGEVVKEECREMSEEEYNEIYG